MLRVNFLFNAKLQNSVYYEYAAYIFILNFIVYFLKRFTGK